MTSVFVSHDSLNSIVLRYLFLKQLFIRPAVLLLTSISAISKHRKRRWQFLSNCFLSHLVTCRAQRRRKCTQKVYQKCRRKNVRVSTSLRKVLTRAKCNTKNRLLVPLLSITDFDVWMSPSSTSVGRFLQSSSRAKHRQSLCPVKKQSSLPDVAFSTRVRVKSNRFFITSFCYTTFRPS